MRKLFILLFLNIFINVTIFSQCESWENYPAGKDVAIEKHVIYRDKLKAGNFPEAYKIWEDLYKWVKIPTPNKLTHFDDGVKLITKMILIDTLNREKLLKKLDEVWDQSHLCLGESSSRKSWHGYHLFLHNYNLTKAYKLMQSAVELAGDDFQAMTISHISRLAVYLYESGDKSITLESLRVLWSKLDSIHSKNSNYEQYRKYWKDAKLQFERHPEIFDCDWWKSKIDLNKLGLDTLKILIVEVSKGCSKDSDFYLSIKTKIEELEVLKLIESEWRIVESDTATVWRKIVAWRNLESLDTVNIQTYRSNIEKLIPKLIESKLEWVDDDLKGAEIYRYAYNLYKRGDFANARTYCRIAHGICQEWGAPLILIGIMYINSNCGDEFDKKTQIWVAIDEWTKAKRIDPKSEDEANSLISKYIKFMPTKVELSQRGLVEGSAYQLNCWIQQPTRVRGY